MFRQSFTDIPEAHRVLNGGDRVGGRFQPRVKATGRRFGILLLALLMVVGAGGYWWFQQSSGPVTASAIAQLTDSAVGYGSAAISVPRDAIGNPSHVRIAAQAIAPTSESQRTVSDQYIGGLYLLSPAGRELAAPATLTLSFSDDGQRGMTVRNPRIGFWLTDRWETIPSTYDPATNAVSGSLTRLYPAVLAIVPEDTYAPQGQVAGVADVVFAERDLDADGLSDEREAFYGTDPANPDSDADSYPDGMEVHAGYDPTGPGHLTY